MPDMILPPLLRVAIFTEYGFLSPKAGRY